VTYQLSAHVVTNGKTPVLTGDETRALLDSIPISRTVSTRDDGGEMRLPDLVGLRDRAIILDVRRSETS
jgi:hypothetical protein